MENKKRLVDFRIKKTYEVEVILELDDEVELREVYSKDFPKQFVNYINESDEEQGRGDRAASPHSRAHGAQAAVQGEDGERDFFGARGV